MEKSGNNQGKNDQCIELDNPTQKCINIERDKYCDVLYTTLGEVKKAQTSYYGKKEIHKVRRNLFLWTEENYRIHRNFNMKIGTELVQSNEEVKTNVENYSGWSDDLNKTLKDLSKEIKTVKGLFSELREQACKLEECKNDSCNKRQWDVLTGRDKDQAKKGEEKSEHKQPHPKVCDDIEEIFEKYLICRPTKGLVFDIDSIFKSSSDVVGIQVFSNPNSLKDIQKKLSEESLEFEKKIQDVLTIREKSINELKEKVVTAAKELSNADANRYNKRSDFVGIESALYTMCCHKCECVPEECDCEPRLKKCEEEICDICEVVAKEGFCKEDSNENEDCSDDGDDTVQQTV